ncbi:hypothetical protein F0562_019466 [Nyssa sinensis]|uniref:Uncharacterized protein n=1 Tax=Nyssa sinensis TaxID=561372 RepID=A0A5J5BSF6_9ASTE|nr:hypothetical protein F0562_019466 [Nyssa sinensis]
MQGDALATNSAHRPANRTSASAAGVQSVEGSFGAGVPITLPASAVCSRETNSNSNGLEPTIHSTLGIRDIPNASPDVVRLVANQIGRRRRSEDLGDGSKGDVAVSAPLLDGEQLDFSIAIACEGPPVLYEVPMVDLLDIDAIFIRSSSVVLFQNATKLIRSLHQLFLWQRCRGLAEFEMEA